MTEINTIEGGQKDALLRRAEVKKSNKFKIIMVLSLIASNDLVDLVTKDQLV